MGLIKAAIDSANAVIGDQFKEFVQCPQVDNNVLIQRGVVGHGKDNKTYSEGVISNGSAIVIPQGMAMMIVDNGKIAEFSAEPGTFTWDTSSEPSVFTGGLGKGLIDSIKTIGSRITFGGQTAKDQRVYYVNIKTIPGQLFGSSQPETIFDPVYQSVQVTYNGEYAIRIDDPVILVSNMVGSTPKDTLTYDDIFTGETGRNLLKDKFSQKVSEAISDIMTINNVSFNRIQSYKSDVTDKMNEILNSDWHEKYGIIVVDVALKINASESSQKIIQEMDADLAKSMRMGQAFANNPAAYAAANLDVMKEAAGNQGGAMMGFMGMNMAQQNGAAMMSAMQQGQQPMQAAPAQAQQAPMPGTVFGGVQTPAQAAPVQPEAKACPTCGAAVNGKFCSECGTQL